jgi:hypothetical protein
MKYIAKMMLALLASVTLVIPAYAWDFSASGTMETTFNSTSTKTNKDAKAASSGGVSSTGKGLTLKSSNTDGDHTASFSYVADWDGNLDQTITVSGSKKAGKWTGSANVSYNISEVGCSNASYAYGTAGDAGDNLTAGDNVTLSSGTAAACAASQTGEDRGAITLTDGTMTIVLGDAGHLSGQNVSSGSSAGGSLSMDAADDDLGVGAFVDSFHGVSLGYKVSDTISVTADYQTTSDANDLLGAEEMKDGETNTTHGTTGAGVGASIAAGPATIGVTVGNASTKDNTGAGASSSTKLSVMGLGVKIDLGDIDPFLSYGSNSTTTTDGKGESSTGGMELGLTYAMGSDSVVVYYGSLSEKSSKTDKATATTGIEVGYSTAVGPASLSVGYGTKTKADDDGTGDGDGYSYSD